MNALHLNNNKNVQKPAKLPKAERKDKGVQKISTASKFFNIILPAEFEQAIISGQGKSIHIAYDHHVDEDDDVDHSDQNMDASQFKRPNGNLSGAVAQC